MAPDLQKGIQGATKNLRNVIATEKEATRNRSSPGGGGHMPIFLERFRQARTMVVDLRKKIFNWNLGSPRMKLQTSFYSESRQDRGWNKWQQAILQMHRRRLLNDHIDKYASKNCEVE